MGVSDAIVRRAVLALLMASCWAAVVSGFRMQRTTTVPSVSASMSRLATTKLHLKPSEKDLFDYRAFDPASIRPMSPADDVDRRTSLVGEDSARFDWSEQSLSSWIKFAIAVSSVLGVLYVVWLAEWGPQWGEAFTTNVEALAGGNSTVAITLMMLFFAICHSGLASLRPAGEDLVGPRVWRYLFAMVSLPLAYSSIGYFVEHRNDGVRLWDLRSEPWMRPAVFAASVLSFLFLYPSTFNLLEVAAVDEPKLHLWETGIARITRHPQTVGQILWCAAHTAYIGTSFACAASAVLCGHHMFSVWNGDRRLRDKFGAEADLLRERTSVVPFAAILSGKQQLPPNFWRDEMLRLPYATILVGSVLAYLAHDQLRGGPTTAAS